MPNMLSRINSTAKAIWRKMRDKEYCDSFIGAHISNTISAQIHAMRKARDWTQSELASRCDMKQSRISPLEDPDLENVEIGTLQRLASAFDVALSVQFVPFSEIVRRSTTLTPSDFVVRDFQNDAIAELKLILSANCKLVVQVTGYDASQVRYSENDFFASRAGGERTLAFIPKDERTVLSMTIPTTSNLLH